jgi:prepilin signal peptidase PulO-like enzyme (type II secretory pathway)
MIVFFLVIFGLILGSFVNALVWRLREQELIADMPAKKATKQSKLHAEELSIS